MISRQTLFDNICLWTTFVISRRNFGEIHCEIMFVSKGCWPCDFCKCYIVCVEPKSHKQMFGGGYAKCCFFYRWGGLGTKTGEARSRGNCLCCVGITEMQTQSASREQSTDVGHRAGNSDGIPMRSSTVSQCFQGCKN